MHVLCMVVLEAGSVRTSVVVLLLLIAVAIIAIIVIVLKRNYNYYCMYDICNTIFVWSWKRASGIPIKLMSGTKISENKQFIAIYYTAACLQVRVSSSS